MKRRTKHPAPEGRKRLGRDTPREIPHSKGLRNRCEQAARVIYLNSGGYVKLYDPQRVKTQAEPKVPPNHAPPPLHPPLAHQGAAAHRRPRSALRMGMELPASRIRRLDALVDQLRPRRWPRFSLRLDEWPDRDRPMVVDLLKGFAR